VKGFRDIGYRMTSYIDPMIDNSIARRERSITWTMCICGGRGRRCRLHREKRSAVRTVESWKTRISYSAEGMFVITLEGFGRASLHLVAP
jgi:hypothetical protein